jgi:penicillin amidase
LSSAAIVLLQTRTDKAKAFIDRPRVLCYEKSGISAVIRRIIVRRKVGRFGAIFVLVSWIGFSGNPLCPAEVSKETILLKGLSQPVEILQDRWGISHIYAYTESDLFFAQGFNAARDRLFQLEIWRRRATGTLSEILGSRALLRDIGARLLKARPDTKKEFNHYHPRGADIIGSFVRGINAYIDLTSERPELLPIEFRLLGIKPGHWTPEVVISRHNGLFRNAGEEVVYARLGAVMGLGALRELLDLHPGNPELQAAEGLDLSLISPQVLELYNASRSEVEFRPEDIADHSFRGSAQPPSLMSLFDLYPAFLPAAEVPGSNNWVIAGRLSSSGFPLLANDPHRKQMIPSLRYWVHLVGPGWNVIGGGEPALPGVSIGHNEFGAWGLTIFAIDQEDLMVYDQNSANPKQYRYAGRWEDMTIIREAIPVKGRPPYPAELKFTRHGPILDQDKEHRKVYALRAAWLEPGGAPYLASLRLDQARNWEEFQEACAFSLTPSENMVWADRQGNIGWQAVGIAPLRSGWNGLLPVPGDGRFEWNGYLPGGELPRKFNPAEGFIATANQNNIPEGYPYPLGFQWAEPYRFGRIEEVLKSKTMLTLTDMTDLQQDYLSLPARQLVPLLREISSPNPMVQKSLEMLLSWDCRLGPESIAAAVYASWLRRLSENVWNLLLPEKARPNFDQRSLQKLIGFLSSPPARFGPDPLRTRNAVLLKSLTEAVEDLMTRLGPELNQWRYGQEKFHHICLNHPLSRAVRPELRSKLDLGPLPRGGDGSTVNNTSSYDNQDSGASFRIVVDLEDWDRALGTNTPGQSGDPASPHYADLFKPWAEGGYFPIFFSRSKIEAATEKIILLKPLRGDVPQRDTLSKRVVPQGTSPLLSWRPRPLIYR